MTSDDELEIASRVLLGANPRKYRSEHFDGVSHRIILKRMILENHWTKGIEVGVEKGTTFLHVLKHCPSLNMTGVDAWEPQPEKDKFDALGGYSYVNDDLPGHFARLQEEVREKYPDRGKLIKGFSVDVAQQIKDRSVDFVFIDASHLETDVAADIDAWRPKVKPGGMLIGHDFHFQGVKNSVERKCPGYRKLEQEMWSVTCEPVIAITPYSDDLNLGRAHNEAIALLPEDGWAIVLDHDVMFTTPKWHRQITAAIIEQPDACFAPVTNRIRCTWQKVAGVDQKNHDITFHRNLGAEILAKNESMREITNEVRTPAGLCMIMSKRAWRDAGGFPEGLHYMDRMMWEALKKADRRLFLLPSLYLYHWHRGAGEAFQPGEWAVQHRLPNGKTITLSKNRDELPRYGVEPENMTAALNFKK